MAKVPATQSTQTVEPARDAVPSMQAMQLLAEVCADSELYVPAEQ